MSLIVFSTYQKIFFFKTVNLNHCLLCYKPFGFVTERAVAFEECLWVRLHPQRLYYEQKYHFAPTDKTHKYLVNVLF